MNKHYNMKCKNVIWIVIDSVRNYHTDADDRGRIDVMDKLAQKAIEFKTAVTSAPSTVMATSAMMTGVPSIFHSRTYNDFDFERCDIKSLPLLLEEQGYHLYNVIFFPEGRIFLGRMMGNMCEDCWPKNAKPNEHWDNDLVNDILANILKKTVQEPFFLFLNYNCRHDPKTSEKVEYGLKMLEEHHLLDDAVLAMNSDHGYPDPSRKITFYERRKFGHDLVMTDDNILVPLIISYPGCKHKTIEKPVSLLDVMPTILELIGLPQLYQVSGFPSYGHNLMPLVDNREENHGSAVSVDNRYIFQDRRITALRTGKYKYVYSFDDGIEEFYDLQKDPQELENLTNNDEYIPVLQSFRDDLSRQEKTIYTFHEKILRKYSEDIFKKKYRTVIFLGWPHRNFVKMMAGILPDYGVEKIFVFENNPSRKKSLAEALKDVKCKIEIVDNTAATKSPIDLALAVFNDNDPRKKYLTRKLTEKFKPGQIIYTNYNLRVFPRPSFWLAPLFIRFVRTMLPRLKKNPKEFFIDLVLLTKRVFCKYKI
jgi:hypothetical protein